MGKINKKFWTAGVNPNTYIIDNEASMELKETMKENEIQHQLVPPHNHRANLAERAIQTYKSHFKAILATVDPDFPLVLWDLLIPQTNITLNLLHTARVNPKLSAHAYLFGNFDFTATPLAPPGTKVVAFSSPTVRTSWGPHGIDGWYVGPALEHYRCVDVYFPKTRSVCPVDTIKYIPHVINFPQATLEDHLRQASSDIVAILQNPPSQITTDLQSGNEITNALSILAEILQRSEKIPTLQKIKEAHNKTYPLPRVSTNSKKPLAQSTLLPRVPDSNPVLAKLGNKLHQRRQLPQSKYNLRSTTQPTSYRARAARYLLAQHIFSSPHINHIYNSDGKRLTIDDLLKGPTAEIW